MNYNKQASIFIAIIFGLSIFVYLKDPFLGPILPCIFNKITGLYCPGCGITRAVNSIFHLKFKQAFQFNALIFIMPIGLIFYYTLNYRGYIKLAKVILILMLIIVIGYGLLRNIPVFEFLKPKNYNI